MSQTILHSNLRNFYQTNPLARSFIDLSHHHFISNSRRVNENSYVFGNSQNRAASSNFYYKKCNFNRCVFEVFSYPILKRIDSFIKFIDEHDNSYKFGKLDFIFSECNCIYPTKCSSSNCGYLFFEVSVLTPITCILSQYLNHIHAFKDHIDPPEKVVVNAKDVICKCSFYSISNHKLDHFYLCETPPLLASSIF